MSLGAISSEKIEWILSRESCKRAENPKLSRAQLKTLDETRSFTVSHDEMVDGWDEARDRELGLLNGNCFSCWNYSLQRYEKKEVVTQVGAARFGLTAGICFFCINSSLSRAKFKELEFDVPFQSSEDLHWVRITVSLLKNLAEREEAIGESEVEQPLSDLNRAVLNKILEASKDTLERCEREQSRPISCKTCRKLTMNDKSFKRINDLRLQKVIMGLCLGCEFEYVVNRGCSMVTCPTCISRTVTCVVCLDGGTGLTHHLSECTAKMSQLLTHPETADPLPPLLKCDCEVKDKV